MNDWIKIVADYQLLILLVSLGVRRYITSSHCILNCNQWSRKINTYFIGQNVQIFLCLIWNIVCDTAPHVASLSGASCIRRWFPTAWDPFNSHGLISMLSWICNYIHEKALGWNYLSIPQPFRFWNGYVILTYTSLGMRLLIHAGIKFNPCS